MRIQFNPENDTDYRKITAFLRSKDDPVVTSYTFQKIKEVKTIPVVKVALQHGAEITYSNKPHPPFEFRKITDEALVLMMLVKQDHESLLRVKKK